MLNQLDTSFHVGELRLSAYCFKLSGERLRAYAYTTINE